MPQQRNFLLLGAICLLMMMSSVLFYRQYQFNTTHYRTGDVPPQIINELLPETIPLEAIRPPAIRPTDFVRYGSATSVISIIEYGDAECESCRQMTPELLHLAEEQKGKVRFLWRDFPMTEQHPHALDAALFLRCAGQQQAYWQAFDLLMRTTEIKGSVFTKIGEQLKLDTVKLALCQNDPSVTEAITKDREESQADGIQNIPFIFIGTKGFQGSVDTETLKQTLQANLTSP